MSAPPPSSRVDRQALALLHPLDPALELMFYGWKGMTREADDYLAGHGLSRAHHRILFVIARREVTMGELVAALGLTKQAVHRPMKHLLDRGLVVVRRDPARHRYKLLALGETGAVIEHEASARERAVMAAAFADAGDEAQRAWMAVMAEVARRA